jgi:non-heme chloroperoxidase
MVLRMALVTVGRENSAAIELFYEDRGSGAPVLLVHGYPLPSDAWERQATALIEEGHRVITFDRRGHGKSSRPSGGYDWDTLARDVNVLMTTLDLEQAVMAGHSHGTGDVMRYLRLFGSRCISRVALIAPLSPAPQFIGSVNGEAADDARFADRFADLATLLDDYYNVDVSLGSRVSREVLRRSWDISAAASPLLARSLSTALLEDFRPDIENIDVPVLLLFAADDRIIPPLEVSRRAFDRLALCKSVTIAGAPHGLLWTHAAEVNAALLEFIDG